MASAQVEALLVKLRNLPYVSGECGVNTRPIQPANKANHFGIKYYVTPPGAGKMTKRSAVTELDGDRPTFLAAVEEAIAVATTILQKHGVQIDPEQRAAERPPSTEELRWLAEWIDEQLAPEAVTLDQANAALAVRRSSQADSSQVTSSQEGSSQASTGFTRLQEAQLQRAQLSAAQKRLQRMAAQVERLQTAMPEEQASKRARSEPAVPDHPRVASGGANPLHWDKYHSYSHATYQKLETEEQDRRAVEIDRSRRDRCLPPGDDTRGWFHHWRRGVGPTLRGWAAGSLGAIIFMLAACAREFDVVDELAAELGCMPKAYSRQAETCIYAMSRAREAFAVLKWCKTEHQREDYHVGLGILAPRRTANDTDPDGMIERVAAELGVTPGKRCPAPCVRMPCMNTTLLFYHCCVHPPPNPSSPLHSRSYHKPSGTQRPRAFEQATTRRNQTFDVAASKFPLNAKGQEIMPWCVGSTVLCRGQRGTIEKFASGVYSTKAGYASSVGGCTITFDADGERALIDYTSLGAGKGGARLQREPPSLRPLQRNTPSFHMMEICVLVC
eukprot:3976256-Prymnesium_polylepis.1